MKKDLYSAGIDIKITFYNGCYSCELPPYYSDISEFSTIFNNTHLYFDIIDDKSADNYKKLLSIYQGDFLSYNGYSWSSAKSALYLEQFETALYTLSRYYYLLHHYESAKTMLTKLIVIDNLNEKYHELLLQIYFQEKNYSTFILHYLDLEKTLMIELGTLPKRSIHNLYDFVLTQKVPTY